MPSYRFGKLPPKRDYRTLRLKDYMTAKLAPPPESFDVLPQVYKKLKISDPTKLFPMDGNDTLGDCTIAALAHAITVYRGLIGNKKIMSKRDVIKLYYHLTGGIDSGMDCLDVVNYWRRNAVAGDEILAYATLDLKNHTHVEQTIQLFGGVYLGFQVEKDCLDDFKAHRPWTPGPLINEGHCVYAVAYDKTGLTVLTWGNIQKATWDWWDECVDEAFALLPPEAQTPGFAPGFDFDQLKNDLAEVAN
jgi:hypothetical protein